MTDVSALEAYAGQLSEAAAKSEAAAQLQHKYVHGAKTVDVATESGPLPTLAKQAVQAQDKVTAVLMDVASQMTGSGTYTTAAWGLQKTSPGAFFSVPSATNAEYLILYENVAGAAVERKRYPSTVAIDETNKKLAPIEQTIQARDTVRSGWVAGEADAFDRILSAVNVFTGVRHVYIPQKFEDQVFITRAVYGGEAVSFKRMTPRSGWLWGYQDKNERVFFGQKVDGSVCAWGSRLLNEKDRSELEALIANHTVPPAVSQAFESLDAAGKQQIYARDLATGVVRRLSASGSNNSNPQMTADSTHVMYTTDRAGGLGPGRLAAPMAGGAERLVVPRRAKMTSIGDSLTSAANESSGILSWPTRVGATQGWDVTNQAIPSYTSTGQAALVGAIPSTVTATGNSIGGNGAVTVLTSIAPLLLNIHNGRPEDNVTRAVAGQIVGVHGTLRRRGQWNGTGYDDLYDFTSDAGTAAAPCPAGSIFYPDAPDQENQLLSICLGTNRGIKTVESDAVVQANVDAIINWNKPLYKKILLFGLPTIQSSLNACWRSAYPQYYALDSAGRDINQRLRASGDGSAKDNEYVAAGRVPYSLLLNPDAGDYIHLNSAGNAIWAQFANEVIQARGYSI